MIRSRVRGAAGAAVLSLCAVPAAAQSTAEPQASPTLTPTAIGAPGSPAATVWQLRAGLNVAALACRGPGEATLVAGYNRLLNEHRAEFAAAYAAVTHDYADAASFDAAMTRLYNRYAQPGSQATLCATAQGVLDRLAANGAAPLRDAADGALATLDGRFTLPVASATQVAVSSIPQIVAAVPLAEQGDPYDDGD